MELRKLLKGVGLGPGARVPALGITSVVANSKDVKKGSLFVAIKGFASDGHEFVREAFRKGARAALAEGKQGGFRNSGNIFYVGDTRKALSVAAKNFYGSPSERLKVIGITGTNGKTTTSLLLESIFARAGVKCGVIGTIDYRFGGRAISAGRTTPDAPAINGFLDKMLKSGMKAAVMEVSSHGLDQKRVDDVFFDAAIFTNLTHEHLDYHGDMEGYFASKVKIFSRLKKKGVAIINADDKWVSRLKRDLKRKKITYGLNRPSDVSADIKADTLDGSSFTVRVKGKGKFSVHTKLMGPHNISNILAATAAGVSQGISLRAIKEGIERVRSVSGRLEPVRMGQGFRVFVDYAHTHNALERVLGFLHQVKRGRIITVFGCGGERDRKKRPLMGNVAQKFSDFAIITNDNPRGEDPRRIARDAERGMDGRRRNYAIILNRRKAIESALKKANPGDIVLVAGKGHETEQVLGNKTIAFDDRKVAEEILRKGDTHLFLKEEKVSVPFSQKVSIDSRTIKKGDTFIAIKGKRFDGHDFVKMALAKGARSAIVSRDVKVPLKYKARLIRVRDTVEALGEIAKSHRAKFKIPVVAITGSSGKTTAKELASEVLSSKYKVLKNETSKNNLIGLPLTLLRLKKKHQIAVLEMGMNRPGEIDRLAEIASPDIGVITNIGPSHLELLGTLKNVFRAKSELLKHLSGKGAAILNKDDAYLGSIKELKCRRVYFGIKKRCRFRAENISRKSNKWFFSLGRERFELPLPGRHNIYNALIAAALAREFGIDFASVRKSLKQFKQALSGRLEFKTVRGLGILDDSYNSNPLSMECAIDALAGYRVKGKRIIVSGDMMELGAKAKAMHESIGRKIASLPVDVLITLGKLSEFTNKGAKQGGVTALYHTESHREAADFLRKVAKPGDVALVKGSRAMEMEKVITCYTTYFTR